VSEGHLRYLWRAYRRDELRHFPLPPDLDPSQFREQITALLAALVEAGGAVLMFVNKDEIPIGMVGVTYGKTQDRIRAFPHAVWFQEGTARQRLEVSLRFLLNLKKTHLVVIECMEADWRFFQHLCKYGVLRRVGTIRDAYGEGKRSAIYQSVGK
jgi:hypothetical protein